MAHRTAGLHKDNSVSSLSMESLRAWSKRTHLPPVHADVSSHGRQSSADGVPVDGLVDGLIRGNDVQDEGLREMGETKYWVPLCAKEAEG